MSTDQEGVDNVQETEAVLAGRILNILIPSNSSTQHAETLVVIQRYNISVTRDARMSMPVLSLSPDIAVAKPTVSKAAPQHPEPINLSLGDQDHLELMAEFECEVSSFNFKL
ncbi:hypothetical protein B0H14DRAFT_2645293 [Mycena olivaceomarginata]|nr:hypothetical protein B0H14DRAFT_2645293 [Mycena olivaceomarginata]